MILDNIESHGQYDNPAEIFLESCKILIEKCNVLKQLAETLEI